MKNAFRFIAVLLVSLFGILPVQVQASDCCVVPTVPTVSPPPLPIVDDAPPPQTPPAIVALEQPLQQGWNLLVNPFVFAIDVASTFGSYDQQVIGTMWAVQTVWTWNNATSKWRFWSPQLTSADNAQYAKVKGYEVATQIAPGEGYWLNSAYNTNLPRIVGEQFVRTPENFAALPSGWNLIGVEGAPRQFNVAVNPVPVQSCMIPINFTTLWAWDTGSAKWIFYSPQLETLGGSAAYDFTMAKGYQDGTYWPLQRGAGFWVNKPATQTQPIQQSGCGAKG